MEKFDGLAMAAWWDPKSRQVILNPFSQMFTVVPGILAVGAEHIAFVRPGSVIFDLPLEQVEFIWKSLPGAGRFGMKSKERDYVFYIVQPHYADKLSKSDLEKVGEGLKLTSIGAEFIGASVASFADWLGTAGDMIEAFSLTTGIVSGMRNYKQLRKLVDPIDKAPPETSDALPSAHDGAVVSSVFQGEPGSSGVTDFKFIWNRDGTPGPDNDGSPDMTPASVDHPAYLGFRRYAERNRSERLAQEELERMRRELEEAKQTGYLLLSDGQVSAWHGVTRSGRQCHHRHRSPEAAAKCAARLQQQE